MTTYEVWFSYRGSRRWRACPTEGHRDAAVAELAATEGVQDINVIELED